MPSDLSISTTLPGGPAWQGRGQGGRAESASTCAAVKRAALRAGRQLRGRRDSPPLAVSKAPARRAPAGSRWRQQAAGCPCPASQGNTLQSPAQGTGAPGEALGAQTRHERLFGQQLCREDQRWHAGRRAPSAAGAAPPHGPAAPPGRGAPRLVRWISGMVLSSSSCWNDQAVYRRKHRPGAVRPARPARCCADALLTGVTMSDSMPLRGL